MDPDCPSCSSLLLSSMTSSTSWSWSSVLLLLHIHHSPSTPSPPPPLAGWSWTVLHSSPSTRRATTGAGMVWHWAPGPSWPAWSLLQSVERWWWGSLRRPSSLRLVRHPEKQRGLWFVFLKNSDFISHLVRKLDKALSATCFMLCNFFFSIKHNFSIAGIGSHVFVFTVEFIVTG